MKTTKQTDARPSGQSAASSAQKRLTPDEIGEALGAGTSHPVGSLAEALETYQSRQAAIRSEQDLEREMCAYISLIKEGKAGGEFAEELAKTEETPEEGFFPEEAAEVSKIGGDAVCMTALYTSANGKELVCLLRNSGNLKPKDVVRIRRRRDNPAFGKIV